MAVANPNINPLAELGAFLPGDTLERLAVLLAEPDARHTCGQLARLGAAFSSLGASLTDAARSGMHERLTEGDGRAFESGVLFQWRRPSVVTAVDTQRVRAAFPPTHARPDLYKTAGDAGGGGRHGERGGLATHPHPSLPPSRGKGPTLRTQDPHPNPFPQEREQAPYRTPPRALPAHSGFPPVRE